MIRTDAAGAASLAARGHVHVVTGGESREEIYDYFAQEFDFPEYFGRNLDALLDCLRDVADRHQGPWTLLWDLPPGHSTDPDPGVVDVLTCLEEECADLTVAIAR